MAKVAQPVNISEAERMELERWQRAQFTPQQVALRARIVLLAGAGKQDLEIAAELGVSRHTSGLWRKRFGEKGLAGIWQMAPGRGRKAIYQEKKVAGIVNATLGKKSGGETNWSCRSLAREKKVSPSTIGRIWREHNLTPRRNRKDKTSRAAQFLKKLTDVVGLYLNPPDKALVLCVDRSRQICALDRPRAGHRRSTVPHDKLRHETTTLPAALESLAGKVVGQCYPRHRQQEFIKFLSRLDAEFPPELTLHLVLDHYDTHKQAKTAAWLAGHPRFVLHIVPSGSSWLHHVEKLFTELSGEGGFVSAGDLVETVAHFLEHWNELPRPFTWSAVVAEIANKIHGVEAVESDLAEPPGRKRKDKYSHLRHSRAMPVPPLSATSRDSKSVKMADVAKAAGVHQTTVSRALRSDPALPMETRRHLTGLAEQMGYRRNPLVSALIAERKRGKQSGQGVVLAVLSPGSKPTRWRSFSPTYAQLYRYMQEQAEELGYRLEEFALENPDLSPERLRRILLNRGIRGVVLTPMPIEMKAIQFEFDDFAAVAMRLHLPYPAIDRIVPDYFSAMSTALDKLIATGHRRIGFITDPAIDERVRHRSLGAFLVARQVVPKHCLSPKVIESWSPPEFHAWMKKFQPDAILTPIYRNWLWVKQQLQEGGWELPRELSLASLDCHTDTPEAGIAHNLKLEAASAIKLLARKVECAEFGIPKESSRLTISGAWRDGDFFAPRTGISRTKSPVKK